MPSNKINDYTKAEILQGIREAQRKKLVKMKRCPNCHKEFTALRKDKIYCCQECQVNHWIDRKVETVKNLKRSVEELTRENELLAEENKYLRKLVDRYL